MPPSVLGSTASSERSSVSPALDGGERVDARSPRSPPTSPAQYLAECCAFHAKRNRSRAGNDALFVQSATSELLRQPGGFEGLRSLRTTQPGGPPRRDSDTHQHRRSTSRLVPFPTPLRRGTGRLYGPDAMNSVSTPIPDPSSSGPPRGSRIDAALHRSLRPLLQGPLKPHRAAARRSSSAYVIPELGRLRTSSTFPSDIVRQYPAESCAFHAKQHFSSLRLEKQSPTWRFPGNSLALH